MIRSIKRSSTVGEAGFVAIFSVLMIMGILTLLVIGFSNITRNAQKRALDDHLSSQAFYAAESGISMATYALQQQPLPSKSDCGGQYGGIAQTDYMVDADNGIEITCLLVNTRVTSYEYEAVPVLGEGDPIVTAPVTIPAGGSLSVSWDNAPTVCGGSRCNISRRDEANGGPQLVDQAAWGNDVGVMRVDLIPAGMSPSAANRDNLLSSSYSFLLYPTSGPDGGTAVSAQSGLDNQGTTFITQCNSTSDYRCVRRVSIAPGQYYVRMLSYYQPTSTSLSVLDNVGGYTVLEGGQALVDVTARANDVYRRLQARVPLDSNASYRTGLHEAFSIFSGVSICKRYIAKYSFMKPVDAPCPDPYNP